MRPLIFNQTTEAELLSGTRCFSLPEASRPGGVCHGLPRPAAAGRNICTQVRESPSAWAALASVLSPGPPWDGGRCSVMGRGGQLCFLKWVSSPPLEIALGTNWGFLPRKCY